jgi:four helix bundle protein
MEKRNYKELIVWQRSIELVPKVYELLKRFPRHELYGLSDQIRRAAISIPANIAEGQARQHNKEFIQHLSIAKGSLAELNTLLIIALRLNYIDKTTFRILEKEIGNVGRPLSGLITRLRGR